MSKILTSFKFIRQNLLLKVFVIIFLTTWPVVIMVLIYSTIVTKTFFKSYVSGYYTQSLNNCITAIDQKLFNLRSNVEAFSRNNNVINYLLNLSYKNFQLAEKDFNTELRSTGPWKGLFVTDRDGKILISNDQNLRNQSLFETSSGSFFRTLKNKNEKYSDAVNTDGSSSNLLFLEPIIVDSKNIGYIAAIYELSNVGSLLSLAESDHIHLYNRNGDRILMLGSEGNVRDHKGIDDIFSKYRDSGSAVFTNTRGGDDLVILPSFVSGLVAEYGWRIIGTIDIKTLYKSIDDFRFAVYLIAALALILVNLLLLLYFSHGIIQPLNKLKQTAQKIAAGDYMQRADASSRTDVIGRLQYAINDMAMTLINQHYRLETKVKEQTIDLKNKIKELEKSKTALINVLEDLQQSRQRIITAQKEEAALLASIGDAVVAIDRDKRIILFNRAAEKITGMSAKQVIGKTFEKVLHFKLNGNKNPTLFIDTALAGKTTKMPKSILLKNKVGKFISIADSAAPVVQHGKVIGAIVVFRDVTKEIEADKAKSEFVSLASHQLRTPLTAVNWYVEILKSGEAGELKPSQIKFLNEIEQGNKRMVELVDALLNMSRIELGTVAIEPSQVDVMQIVTTTLDDVKRQVKEKTISVKVVKSKTVPKIFTDPRLLNIILQNLISNSIKYTPKKGKVEVRIQNITNTKQMGKVKVPRNSILFSVADNGYGIPKDEQSKVFSKLFRATNIRLKTTDGTGLGLYIVKLIIDKLQGKIWFTSVKNHGSTFSFYIPYKAKLIKSGEKPLEK